MLAETLAPFRAGIARLGIALPITADPELVGTLISADGDILCLVDPRGALLPADANTLAARLADILRAKIYGDVAVSDARGAFRADAARLGFIFPIAADETVLGSLVSANDRILCFVDPHRERPDEETRALTRLFADAINGDAGVTERDLPF